MPREPRSVRDEIRQTRPFRSPGHEAVVALFRTTDAVKRVLSRQLEQHGITLQQYNVLRILRGAGEPGLPSLEIASRMIEQSPGITRMLDRLVAKKLVSRERCPEDRRQVICRLASRGGTLLAALDPVVDAADQEVFAGLGEDELQALVRTLDTIRSGIRQ